MHQSVRKEREAATLTEFVEAIARTAYLSRSQRGGLDVVTVVGKTELYSSPTAEQPYSFTAEFIERVHGEDNQYQKYCTYKTSGTCDHSRSSESDVVCANLQYIQSELRRHDPQLESRISGEILLVPSAYVTLEKKMKEP